VRRRQFLATGTALLSVPLAGCGHPPAVLDMSDATDEDMADEGSTLARPDSEAYGVTTRARENGTATRRGRHDLFDHIDTVQLNEPFRSVVDRLRKHGGFEMTDGYGRWLVEYEGEESVTYAEW